MSDLADRISHLSPKRLALLALELDERLEAAERQRREPIAIVGLGCRLPAADSPDAFWRLLRDGVDAIRDVPKDRWDVDALYDPDPDAPGRVATRWAGLLDDIRTFDPHFFGISPREALSMDPQQRLLLEVCWEALEHGGISPDGLRGSQSGVFMGVCSSDYAQLLGARGDAAIDAYLASGNAFSVMSGRLSYFLGLHGPSLSVDTACSSSLVAVHLACQSLRAGECRMALAGGVNLMVTPRTTIALSRAHMMAPDGRCKTFDARADGFVRGEGCGVVVLKRLSDAETDGDRILALIRGSAVNQDGRSSGLTAPNGPAQEAVIRAALGSGAVEPADVDYVEAHGTGTSLGDPIEVRALGAVLGPGRPADRPLAIGSVKTNIGHLESAAGVAGLIKIVLALEHGELPPHLHFTSPNPHIAWDALPIEVVRERRPWAAPGKRRLAAVSSFGFSGTNAHVVLEEPPVQPTGEAPARPPLHLLTISAQTDRALADLADRYAVRLEAPDAPAVTDVVYTAATGRAHHPSRLAVLGDDAAALAAGLRTASRGESSAHLQRGDAPADAPEVVFLFTGQGAQYAGMGQRLYETEPTFRRALDACQDLLKDVLPRPLPSVMFEAGLSADLDATGFTQPALFALEYALAELWRSWGVQPAAAMGHSVGEVAAACVAGILTLEDAARLIAARGRLMQALPAGGGMAAVFAPLDRVNAAIAGHSATLAVAAVNGPEHVVISGSLEPLDAVRADLERDGVKSQPLTVSHAFHSPLMRPMVEAFRREAARVTAQPSQIGFVSNVTGTFLAPGEVLGPDYWAGHVMAPVQFSASMAALRARGYRLFLEVGPHPTLLGMARRAGEDEGCVWLPSLRRGRDDWRQMFESLGGLYVHGAAIDWHGVHGRTGRSRVALPTYPFQRQAYWPDDVKAGTEPGREPWRSWLYELGWAEDALGAGSAAFIPPPDDIRAAVTARADGQFEATGAAAYDDLYPQLDRVCAAYIASGLRALGLRLDAGERFETTATAARLGVVPAYQRLFRRLLEILAEDGCLQVEGGGWRVVRPPADEDAPALMRDLQARFPAHDAELSFTARSAPALAEVLTGRRDPLQVLFPGGSLDGAEALYERAPGLRLFNTLLADGVTAAIASKPPRRPLRVLEIGAGTGGTSTYVLERLPAEGTEYVYTDVSPLFLARAREKFARYGFVDYRALDIERDPAEQGFAPGSFDLVLAANVLHATADLRRTLARVRRLVAPGGLLLLLEATHTQRFGDLTVGYTDGWWGFQDRDLRPSYALVPARTWQALLLEAGFAEACTLPADTSESRAIFANQALVFARAPLGVADGASRPAWLVCGDADTLAEGVAALARERGGEVWAARRGDAYTAPGAAPGSVDPEAPEDVGRLIDHVRGAAGNRPLTVIDLWPVGVTIGDRDDVESVTRAVRQASAGALHLARAAVAGGGDVRLVIVTRGAQAVAGASRPLALAQSPVWGFGRSVELEHPELRLTLIDLPIDDAPPAAVLDPLDRPDNGDRQFAWRAGSRYVARLAASDARSGTAGRLALRSDAAYLITGGLSGLGVLVAQHFAQRGARAMVLAGRRAPEPAVAEVFETLRRDGVEIVEVRADVSVAEDVDRIIGAVRATGRPLAGIVHSAGAIDDGLLSQQRWARFETVMSAKVRGAWLLHRATLENPLDFFVLFSTGASLLGAAGQSNHAAANVFLDALAWHRRALGLPGLSINWGAWSEVGAATRGGIVERVATRGLQSIDPAAGLAVLEHLVSSGRPQAGVLPIQWPEFLSGYAGGRRPPIVAAFDAAPAGRAAATGPVMPAAASAQAEPATETLKKMAPHRARATLATWVNEDAARVLGLDAGDRIDPARPLNALGLDSLMAVELRNVLGARIGRTLPATLLFNHPTVGELVTYLGGEVLGSTEPAAEAASPAPEETPERDDLEEMSEEELASLLAGKLRGA
jgi:acyl transferase domain-containing protein/SAM-dependent methyltransferase